MRDRRFWIAQGLVLAFSAGHTASELLRTLENNPGLYLLPISAYFIPVLYAALNFGVEGALPTGLLCVVLSIPNIVLFHHDAERIGVALQLALLVALGVVVAARVDREQRAKQLAEAVSARLAATQESLQSYIGISMRSQEEERHRLSRELHDETVQDLVVVQGALRDLRQGAVQQDRLALIDAELEKSISGIRRICRALRPSVLDDLGLVAALEWLASEMGTRTSVKASFAVNGTPHRFPPDTELAIFRVAQEALRNVDRHAHAKQVQIRLDYSPTGVRLQIEDDGQGFDASLVPSDRLGLAGMHERARLIGARLQIERKRHKTLITLDMTAERRTPGLQPVEPEPGAHFMSAQPVDWVQLPPDIAVGRSVADCALADPPHG